MRKFAFVDRPRSPRSCFARCRARSKLGEKHVEDVRCRFACNLDGRWSDRRARHGRGRRGRGWGRRRWRRGWRRRSRRRCLAATRRNADLRQWLQCSGRNSAHAQEDAEAIILARDRPCHQVTRAQSLLMEAIVALALWWSMIFPESRFHFPDLRSGGALGR